MRSPLSGPIATLLMLVPLCVVPVLAVVGVPQFKSDSPDDADQLSLASADPDGDKSTNDIFAPIANLGEGDHAGGFLDASSPKPSAETPAYHGDTPAGAAAATEQPQPTTSPAPGDWDPPGKAIAGWRLDRDAIAPLPGDRPPGGESAPNDPRPQEEGTPDRADRNAEPPPWANGAPPPNRPAGSDPLVDDPDRPDAKSNSRGDESLTSAAGPTRTRTEPGSPASGGASGSLPAEASQPAAAAATALTWPAAVDRLNKLGIHTYQLQPGIRKNEFHFSCSLTPANNPRVTHRFEAEAGEPLVAVEKVLQQIEDKFQQP